MNHSANADFWLCYRRLPEDIQRIADKSYALLRENPRHPSLQFKKIGEVWSVRVNLHYRALAAAVPDGYVWFWLGTHTEYERLIAQLG